MSEVSGNQIIHDIRAMGVRPGDLLLVHSSLKSIGRVDGGAPTVARAFIDAVSPDGSVFVPTYTYDQHPWDAASAPSVVGAITEAFRHLPGVIRSLHCTHSVAGAGPEAHQILQGHELTDPFSIDSPLGKLWKRNAWVLLLGCDHRSSSIIHVAEEAEQVPQLARTREQTILSKDGPRRVTVRRPGSSHDFWKIDAPLRARGAIIDGYIGHARCMLIRAEEIVETARHLLRDSPAALLCDDPACESCSLSRALIAASR